MLLNANFHIDPLKKNHLKFRQIQNVAMWGRMVLENAIFFVFSLRDGPMRNKLKRRKRLMLN